VTLAGANKLRLRRGRFYIETPADEEKHTRNASPSFPSKRNKTFLFVSLSLVGHQGEPHAELFIAERELTMSNDAKEAKLDYLNPLAAYALIFKFAF